MPMIGIALIVVYFSLEWAEKYNAVATLLKIFALVLILLLCC